MSSEAMGIWPSVLTLVIATQMMANNSATNVSLVVTVCQLISSTNLTAEVTYTLQAAV